MSFRNTEIGKLPSEWDVKTLKECSTKITDGTHSTVKDNKDGEYYLLSCKNVKNGNVVLGEKERKIDLDTLKKLRKRTNMDIGDLLLTTVGTIGESAIVKDLNFEFQRSVAIIKLYTKKVNKNFAYYITKDRYFKYQVSGRISGSVQKCLYLGDINNIKIPLPSLAEQKAIAKILSDLDEKIEVNNKINKNLEEMAQAIFKQWFVDFEFPNEEGKPYKSSGGEMVESELGIIPKGWNCGLIENIATVIGGATPSKKNESYFINGNIPWVTPKDLSDNKNIYISKGTTNITKEAYKSTSVKFMPRNTVLFSSRAPIGYIAIAKNELTTNQGFKSLVPNNDIGMTANYIYCFLKSIKKSIENRASGSTFKEISGSELKKIEVIIPAKGILQKYYKFTENIFWEIENIESENERLEKLRDTLLPKLMSGEIRVPLEYSEN